MSAAPGRALQLFAGAADHIRHGSEPGSLYAALDAALQELVAYKLLTVLRLQGGRLHRMHTSDLQSYPTGGSKDITGDPWLQTLLGNGVPVISPDPHTVQQRFVDHEAIFALGCGSVMNIPVTSPAGTLGSLNLLHETGWFTQTHVQLARPFAALLAVAWLSRPLTQG